MTGGLESGGSEEIQDYDFIIDRYFFIDETFRNNFYPLDPVTNSHQYDSSYVVGNYEIYIYAGTSTEGNPIVATAYLKPDIEDSHNIHGSWKRLEENVEYEIDRLFSILKK